ncbi:hypothetical protein LI291_10250 [Intestinibacillus massiliensis]|uniref:hypothetical protein n=1 Tax=Intestinibacillus massiliensis TaxID=1871029 RepID=UPI000B362228|nr:hypothetical protein [Intestinibacillus massiliensis]MCB6366551.1 hypothetical protein [Intestinibacillus massiliensis]
MEEFIVHPLLQTDRYGKIFLYTTQNDTACVPRHTIQMDAPVRPKLLQQAVKDALLRFPHMSVGIRATATSYEYRMVGEEPVVLPFDNARHRYTIGSEDTHGYMFLVGYQGNNIYMEYQHSTSDGRGFEEFIRCVLFQYLKLCGKPVENDGTIRAQDSYYTPAESEDAYRYLDGLEPSGEGLYEKPAALHADGLSWDDDAPEIVCEVTFPFSELRAVAKQYDVSPLTVIAPTFCRAFYNKFGAGQDKPVIAQIPVDMRQVIESVTTRYFICFIDLPYEAAWQEKPLPEAFRLAKGFLSRQMEPELLLYRAKVASDACRNLHQKDIPLAEKEQEARKMTRDFVTSDSFLITNVGRFTLPESMAPYVKGYGAVLPCAAQPFAMLISSYGGTMKVSIAQRDHDLAVCSDFTALLGGLGVRARMESYPFYVTRYDGAACTKGQDGKR